MAEPFETYESRIPSAQNAIDAVPGWNMCFPEGYNVTAGHMPLFDDPRILWALEQFGDIAGKKVLELGPLEGAHTHLLASHGAHVDAIEANKNAFLRCLVTKEIAKTPNANIYLGDFMKYLENTEIFYDLIVACGVLYHMNDPVGLLERASAHTDNLFLWTHFVDVDALAPDDPMRKNWNATLETRPLKGETLRLYRRSYVHANENPEFCGGLLDDHRWMSRDSILTALRVLGLSEIHITHESTASPFGPSFCVYARRPQVATE